MYVKYHTEGFVIRKENTGENDASYLVYTADFGLIRARARAVREERSRMRYALQECARVRISLVRGTRGWRMAGAHAESSALTGEALCAYARVLSLVERLAGEEANDTLFESLERTRGLLEQAPEAWDTIELLAVARVLHALGYLSAESVGRALVLEDAALAFAESEREAFLQMVNQALSGSHL